MLNQVWFFKKNLTIYLFIIINIELNWIELKNLFWWLIELFWNIDEEYFTDQNLAMIQSSAELLYGLIHQRYILTKPGLAQMVFFFFFFF